MNNNYCKDTYTIYTRVIYGDNVHINKINNCNICLVDIEHEMGFLNLPSEEEIPLESLPTSIVYAKFLPENKYLQLYVEDDNHGTEIVNLINEAIRQNKPEFTYHKFGECMGLPFIFEFGLYKEKSNEYINNHNYKISRIIEVKGYKKTLLYENHTVSSVDVLKNSYSFLELPDELGLSLKDFPHFQKVLILYPDCLTIPVLGDEISVFQMVDELNVFLNQTNNHIFTKSYTIEYEGLQIKFTLNLERLVYFNLEFGVNDDV